MKRHSIAFSFCCTAISLLFTACHQENTKQVQESTGTGYCLDSSFRKLIRTTTLETQEIRETITLTGNISYNEDDVIIFKSMLDGMVESVHFELGDLVQKGQVLATMRSTDLNELSQEANMLTNQISLLQQQIDIQTSLYKDGLTALSELQQAKTELANAELNQKRIRQNLKLYNATDDPGLFEIRSPKKGYIVQKEVAPGMNISAYNETVFAISDLNEIWVMVNIYATNMQHVQKGAPVIVRTLAYPDQYFEGKIDKISHVFDQEERVLKARVILQNTDLMLKPGMSADISIHKPGNKVPAVAIPNHAIIFHNNKQYVVSYKTDCDLSIHKIEPVASNMEFTYVRDYPEAGTQVITENELLIFEELNR